MKLLTEVVFENQDPGGDQFDEGAEPLPVGVIQIVGVRHSPAPQPRSENLQRSPSTGMRISLNPYWFASLVKIPRVHSVSREVIDIFVARFNCLNKI